MNKRKYDVTLIVHDGRKLTKKEEACLCKWIREQARYVKSHRNLFADKFTANLLINSRQTDR